NGERVRLRLYVRPFVDAAAEENCALDCDRNRLAVSSSKCPPPDRRVGLEGGDREQRRIQKRRIGGAPDAKEVILAAERAATRAHRVAPRRAGRPFSTAGVDRIKEEQRRSTGRKRCAEARTQQLRRLAVIRRHAPRRLRLGELDE